LCRTRLRRMRRVRFVRLGLLRRLRRARVRLVSRAVSAAVLRAWTADRGDHLSVLHDSRPARLSRPQPASAGPVAASFHSVEDVGCAKCIPAVHQRVPLLAARQYVFSMPALGESGGIETGTLAEGHIHRSLGQRPRKLLRSGTHWPTSCAKRKDASRKYERVCRLGRASCNNTLNRAIGQRPRGPRYGYSS